MRSKSRSTRPARLLLGLLLVAALVCPRSPAALAQPDTCPEPNDDRATACPLGDGALVQATLHQPSDRDAYRIVAEAGTTDLRLELADLPADYDLYLTDANGRVLGQSVHEGTAPELLELAVQPGTYLAFVQADPSREVAPTSPYTLRLTLAATADAAPSIPQSAISAASPPAVPPAAPDSRPILFADTFDDPGRSLFTGPDLRNTEVGYVEGEYSMRNIDPTNRWRGHAVNATYGDAALAVDVRIVGDAGGRGIALNCRWEAVPDDPSRQIGSSYAVNFYPDAQEFGISRQEPGAATILIPRRKAAAIRPDNERNRFEASCVGAAITARANGVDLGSVQDSTLTRGRFVIVIGGPAHAMPHVEVRLDNLTVYGP